MNYLERLKARGERLAREHFPTIKASFYKRSTPSLTTIEQRRSYKAGHTDTHAMMAQLAEVLQWYARPSLNYDSEKSAAGRALAAFEAYLGEEGT